jgi:hypothetical protein
MNYSDEITYKAAHHGGGIGEEYPNENEKRR